MMVVLAAVDGFAVTLLGKWAGHRKVFVLRVAAVLTVFSLAAALAAVGLGYRAHWYWWCVFIILAAAANFAPLIFVVARDNNPIESLGTASSIINSSPYVAVAILAICIGLDHGQWEPVAVAVKCCYPSQAILPYFPLDALRPSWGALLLFLAEEKGVRV